MIRFHFRLRPLAEVESWDDRDLHWFALTDGWYWIEVDGHKLFHHPPNAIAGQPSPVDYYVVRLWEDLLEVLPSLLEPVPADLVDLMTSDQDAWCGAGVEDAEAALDWYSSHFMYTSYLTASPRIVWWRTLADRDTITVDWRHAAEHGLDCTVPRQGQASVPTELFLRALEKFDRELIDAMDQRITEIEARGLDPDIPLDLEQLRHEHQQRSLSLAATLQHVPETDWTAVREGVARIFSTHTQKLPSVATDLDH
ncbi:hypothetical protein DMH03_40710 [Amycolatopsis sp. WAC 01376]|uniref:DUF5984 family protein n=1 Tax=Amycolatopsis sp. WAC 01376 TaxID=2203195 RepID=UPI000F7B0670|nr:DUF5984 family protein [Amycolatopsis sp. WAC 01376]RSM52208.1 hypothetical protein DMH03_40710 [Amycolatopsis sp. WAC 01376]